MVRFNSLGHALTQTINAASQYSMDLARIKGSTLYIKLIKSLRDTASNLIAMTACLMVATASLIIFHVMVLLYAPFSLSAKICFTSIALFVYLSISLVTFFRLHSERRWLKAFKGDEILCEVLEER